MGYQYGSSVFANRIGYQCWLLVLAYRMGPSYGQSVWVILRSCPLTLLCNAFGTFYTLCPIRAK